MKRIDMIAGILVLGLVTMPVSAARKKEEGNVVHIGGMSIIGNRELPKSLYIVPWKESQVGKDDDLSRSLLDERLHAVDPDEFKRELDYYEQSR